MKLLLDQNLSPVLCGRLIDVFPETQHVREVGLRDAPDKAIWKFALANGFIIVTKDADFRNMSITRGAPPKVVWLRLGNCPVRHVELVLRAHVGDLRDFAVKPNLAILIIE